MQFGQIARGSGIGTVVATQVTRAMDWRHKQHARGFSLIELMVVVAIIGLMAAAIAPALSSIQADHRQVNAAMDLVRLSRRARAIAASSGTAQLLRFQASGSNRLGQIERFAGMNSKCQQTPWSLALTAPVNSPLFATEIFDMAIYNLGGAAPAAPADSDSNRQVIVLRAAQAPGPTNVPDAQLCYQPNGETYFLASSAAGVLTRQAVPLRFTITRTVNGVAQGVDRQVVFPVGGSARVQ